VSVNGRTWDYMTDDAGLFVAVTLATSGQVFVAGSLTYGWHACAEHGVRTLEGAPIFTTNHVLQCIMPSAPLGIRTIFEDWDGPLHADPAEALHALEERCARLVECASKLPT
jgi:hypothetical protein